ncbi:hypothetical protein L211DRAFT_468784 [Terfezia boudieri ATCC MYA-4762]|uniref:Uncharacterized protein n=1 Tax=Terfezia boudieri ATCC MYA-4762 TaxID=1051890 RepID=A0A3N4M3B0_9PEZI|nr:hypothetical protein L211DRAFT_468784 [Terfezia boudieri ATCC MYA-4762]
MLPCLPAIRLSCSAAPPALRTLCVALCDAPCFLLGGRKVTSFPFAALSIHSKKPSHASICTHFSPFDCIHHTTPSPPLSQPSLRSSTFWFDIQAEAGNLSPYSCRKKLTTHTNTQVNYFVFSVSTGSLAFTLSPHRTPHPDKYRRYLFCTSPTSPRSHIFKLLT